MEFFDEWQKYPKENRNSRLYDFLTIKHDLANITEESTREIKMIIGRWSSKCAEKWESSGKRRDRFLTKNSEWMSGDFTFKASIHLSTPSSSSKVSIPGRPSTDFTAASERTKRRRVEDLLHTRDVNQLVAAAEISARLSGHRNLASVIKEASHSPEKCQVMRRSMGVREESRCLSKEEALAYYVDAKSTTHSYKQTRKWSIRAGHQVFPSFHSVRQAKIECYPPKEQISINETRAEIKLQAVLNKTAERLICAQREVLKSVHPGSLLFLVSKWGCDGSSGHSTYKQKFTNSEDTDEFLFVFSFVPLQLRDNSGNVVWQNPRPSSTMYCRPIKFIFSKETTDFTVTETNKILEEINQLVPTIGNVDGKEVSVKHELLFTMIDGKVCNAMTETSSAQKCYICGATPKFMNDESREFMVNKENLGFGISPLHAWIRSFECLLHISYRLEVKKWQVRDESDKENVKQRSARIQERFKVEMGLIVDKPKPGFGNTNDGNTARRFFENPEQASDITGVDVTLIKNFGTILRTLASGYDIDVVKFNSFTQDTKKLYLSLYSWYYMPVTVHKILVHSVDIVKSALLPIGQLSEEAQEARNKDYRRFREHNTRKRSRIATNRDLLNMLLITSDPVINDLREVPKKPTRKLPSEVLELIIPPSVNVSSSVSHSSFCQNINISDYNVEDSSEEEFSDVE